MLRRKHLAAKYLSALGKWQLLALVEYRAILLTDQDVDLFLLSRGRPAGDGLQAVALQHAWTKLLDLFLRSNSTLLAAPDYTTPINTAVMLLKPSRSTYDLGLRTLAVGSFDPASGFDSIGPPQRAIPWERMAPDMAAVLNNTLMARHNEWTMVASMSDQGLFVYVYICRLLAATFELSSHRAPWVTAHLEDERRHNLTWWRSMKKPGASRTWAGGRWRMGWRVHHFFGPHKPWRPTARCLAYFDFMDDPAFISVAGTQCHDVLSAKARCLRANLSRAECADCRKRRQKSTCGSGPACPSEASWPVF